VAEATSFGVKMRAQGTSIRAICREVGVSRNTVRQALRSAAPRNTKLIGSCIARELRAGYDGHRSAVDRLLATLKAAAPSAKVTERFEIQTGQQAQFDWSPYTVERGGELTRVIVFVVVLGYSRREHYTASLDETQASIYEAIESCLRHFGGAAKQLVVDNATQPCPFSLEPTVPGAVRPLPHATDNVSAVPRMNGKIEHEGKTDLHRGFVLRFSSEGVHPAHAQPPPIIMASGVWAWTGSEDNGHGNCTGEVHEGSNASHGSPLEE
jgi:hypothetical protein